jgi:membrane-bound lytic murein transglycosylase D
LTLKDWLFSLGPALFLVPAACTPTTPKNTHVTPPPPPAIQAQVESSPNPISSEPAGTSQADAVSVAIVEAETRFKHGEELYSQGLLDQAKEEFDRAIDGLLETSSRYPGNDKLEREITDLIGKVHNLEGTAFKEADGFSEQDQEHAAIDDLRNVQTFPLIDPKFKKEVEEKLAGTPHDLPIEVNDRVLSFLDYYQNGRGRSFIQVGLERAGKYRQMIEQIFSEEGVPLDLIYLCQAESAFVPRAVSRAQATGMWQFMSSRGKEYGLRQTWWIDERSDPEKSTRAAARHLKDLYQEFGDWYLAMAAYNAGPVRIQRAMDTTGANNFWTLVEKKALPRETINYVPTILALTIIGKNPEKFGFSVSPAAALETERVQVDKATDLRIIAEAIRVPVEELRDLNPHVLRWTTPPDDPQFELILPKGYMDAFQEKIAGLPENARVIFRRHTVKKGETLGAIARKYQITAAEIAQSNKLKLQTSLRVGQDLMIPVSGGAPTVGAAAKSVPSRPTGPTFYTVRAGDTLTNIASKYRVGTQDLKRWNNLSSARISVGQKLVVAPKSGQSATSVALKNSSPPSTKRVVHKVRQGETLNQIAVSYNTTVDAILSWNEKNDLTVIHPGDRITIFLGENQ